MKLLIRHWKRFPNLKKIHSCPSRDSGVSATMRSSEEEDEEEDEDGDARMFVCAGGSFDWGVEGVEREGVEFDKFRGRIGVVDKQPSSDVKGL